jgi:CelD/BcsL family acetyltransferase involved in cellulose biosynthesis/predicted RNA methylase
MDVVAKMDAISELHSLADLDRFKSAWRDLEKRAAPHSVTQTYEYSLAAFQRAQENSTRAFLVVLEDGGRMVGVWGLTMSRRSLRQTLEPFSCGSYEEFSGPLLLAGSEVELAERILRLATSMTADRLILYKIDPNGPLSAACKKLSLQHRDFEIDGGLVVPVSKYPTWESAENELSREFRSSLRRYVRRLEELEPRRKLRVRWRDTPKECDQAIDFFIEHKIRWAARHGKRSRWLNDTNSFGRFFKELCRNVDLVQFPVVASVDLGETPIAAALCLNSTIRVEYAFTTYDESFQKFGPGKLLLKYLVEWSLTRGRDFNFGIMIAGYKEEWPVERRVYVSRMIFTTRLGRVPTPEEVRNEVWRAARRRLAPLRPLRDRLRRLQKRPHRGRSSPASQEEKRIGDFRSPLYVRAFKGALWRASKFRAIIHDHISDRVLHIRTCVAIPKDPDPNKECFRYEPMSYSAIKIVKNRIAPDQNDVVYDIGCGMGRIVCFFARLPVLKSVGVELSESLAAVARTNILNLSGKRAFVEVIAADAVKQTYGDATILIVYNPFSAKIMRLFLNNVKQSLISNPRTIRIVYANPVAEEAFRECGWLYRVDRFDAPYNGEWCMPIDVWSNADQKHIESPHDLFKTAS